MNPDSKNWQQLQELFHLAGEAPEPDAALAAACDDPELRQRVLDLLTAGDESPPAAFHPSGPPQEGSVGPYSLIRLIGSGGMGSVYLAERKTAGTTQRVALKLLAPHAAGPSFVERFEREQRILASLEHPRITRMLDAGLGSNGQPYLAMEYVNGVPIDQYCDDHALDIATRLRLFEQACDAVEYAHRKLVVHLDLKPSNILAGDGGLIKLLDFGTAKLMSADGEFTVTLMATPCYASPEQLRGAPPTTACDIYALGVLLFELLTGRRPMQNSASGVIDRALNEREPERLESAVTRAAAGRRGVNESRLRAMLAGDLSTIVTKCLQPRPEERYASVSALNDDIARYLSGRPVLAQKQTTLYQLRKFVRRHRGSVAATGLIVVAMTAATVISIRSARSASLERDRAERVTRFFEDVLNAADPSSSVQVASERKLVDVLATASNRLQAGFADDPGILSELHGTIGRTYMGLGKMEAAQAEVKASIANIDALDDNPRKKAYVMHVAARLDYEMGHAAMAESKERQAVALYDQVSRAKFDPASYSTLLNNLGLFQRAQNEPAEAQQSFERALRALETLRNPPAFEAGLLHHNLGALALDAGNLSAARREIPLAIAKFSSLPTPPAFIASDEANLAAIGRIDGHPEASLELLEKAVNDATRLAGQDHPITTNARIALDLQKSLMGRREGLESELTLLVEQARRPGFRTSLAGALEALGHVRTTSGHTKEGESLLREALSIREKQPKAVYFLAESEE